MATIPFVLLQIVFVPALTALVVAAVGRKAGRNLGWICFAALLYTTLLLLLVGWTMEGGTPSVSEDYAWAPLAGLDFGFLADNLSLPVALVMNLVVTATAVYSMGYMKHRLEVLYGQERNGQYTIYFMLFMLLDTGLIGVSLSTNLIELYLFLELMLIPSTFMVAMFGYTNRERTAMMYFLWNHFGAFLFLAGIIVAYMGTGNFEVASLSSLRVGTLAYWAAGLILIGWLVKMAIFGVHMWLPTAHAEHPTSFAPFIVTIVGVGNYVVVRLLVQGMPTVFVPFGFPLMIMAVITMGYAGACTLVQTDVKYLYAWSTIGQNAYSLLGIGSLSVLGVSGGLFYFLNHIIGKTILFCVAGMLISQTNTRDMRRMGGLASKMPITATLCLLGSMILSAVPPTGGFQAEWVMFTGIFLNGVNGMSAYLAVAILGMIATVLTVGYTFWPMKKMFFGPLKEDMSAVKEAPLVMTVPMLVLVVIAILFGIYPDLMLKMLVQFASSLPLGGL